MNKGFWRKFLLIIGVPVLYAVIIRVLFGVESANTLYTVMSLTFLILSPTIVGALTVYVSPIEDVRRFRYRFFIPWIPIFVFFGLTIVISLEGWACWVMALPLFLIASSIGGLIGGYLKLSNKENKIYVSALTLLPFIVAPAEQMIAKIPGTYEAYTYIDIRSSADRIWRNVTRVKEIRFKLTTTFNFYASWWAKWIMQDIQNNILQVEKSRAESGL